jgi:hypothetical protein
VLAVITAHRYELRLEDGNQTNALLEILNRWLKHSAFDISQLPLSGPAAFLRVYLETALAREARYFLDWENCSKVVSRSEVAGMRRAAEAKARQSAFFPIHLSCCINSDSKLMRQAASAPMHFLRCAWRGMRCARACAMAQVASASKATGELRARAAELTEQAAALTREAAASEAAAAETAAPPPPKETAAVTVRAYFLIQGTPSKKRGRAHATRADARVGAATLLTHVSDPAHATAG